MGRGRCKNDLKLLMFCAQHEIEFNKENTMTINGWVGATVASWFKCTHLRVKLYRFKPWPGTLCSVLGQDTSLSKCLSPPGGV